MRPGRSFLAYVKQTRPTGKYMGQELGCRFGIRPPAEYEDGLDVLIRWGSRKPMPDSDIVLNAPSAILQASDKLATYRALSRAGLQTLPTFTTMWEATDYAQRTHYWVYGRKRFGMGGKDIILWEAGYQEPPPGAANCDFYTTYVPSRREFRIHVVGEKVVRVQAKYHDHPEMDPMGGMIRNYTHGFRFRTPRQELRPRRRMDAIKAIKALGLDFGAVDMIVNGDGGEGHTIIEVNTAPSCSPLTARCYAGELANLVALKTAGMIRLAPDLLEAEMTLDEVEADEADDGDADGWDIPRARME